MPDRRAMNALGQAYTSQREVVALALRRAGYDPDTLQALPDPDDCPPILAEEIRRFRELGERLDAAERRTSGWR